MASRERKSVNNTITTVSYSVDRDGILSQRNIQSIKDDRDTLRVLGDKIIAVSRDKDEYVKGLEQQRDSLIAERDLEVADINLEIEFLQEQIDQIDSLGSRR
jgi:hypothetical protein